MKNILYWPKDTYVPAVSTDIRKTFERVRREQAEAAAREKAGIPNVSQIKRRVK